jgi:hypothetical protein
MTWLLALYPPRWRRRYGDELRALVGAQPLSLHGVIDLIAGAIDAWIEPQNIPIQPEATEEGVTMIGTMKLGCTGSAGRVSREDGWKSLAVNLGGTLLLTAIWMTMHIRRIGDRTYVDSFSAMAFLVPYLFSLHYTSLKGRSPRTQTIFIGGTILMLTLILGAAGWIASKI